MTIVIRDSEIKIVADKKLYTQIQKSPNVISKYF